MTEQRLDQPPRPDGLATFGAAPDPVTETPRTHRAVWISVAAVLVLAAASIPIGLHLMHRSTPPLHTPTHVAGLTLDNSSAAKSTADYLRSAVAADMGLDTSMGAVYADPADSTSQADAHSVIFVGGTAKGSDATLLSKLMSQLTDSTDGLSGVMTEPTAGAGGLMKCGLTTDTATQDAGTDTEMAACAYAGGGAVGMALFPNRTVSQAAALMRQIRSAVA
ncbi:MAG TPA: hypothetical protein VGJ28_00820 [Micromonosporaceae bacterium]|jgi:hypothetical protein